MCATFNHSVTPRTRAKASARVVVLAVQLNHPRDGSRSATRAPAEFHSDHRATLRGLPRNTHRTQPMRQGETRHVLAVSRQVLAAIGTLAAWLRSGQYGQRPPVVARFSGLSPVSIRPFCDRHHTGTLLCAELNHE